MNAPELGGVAVVGTGVISERVQGGVADPVGRPPRQPSEMNDQVGSDVADMEIGLLRLERHRAQGLPGWVGWWPPVAP